jgi:acyl carrier protein
MHRDEIIAKVIELAAAQAAVPACEVSLATHFRNDLEYDSLDAMEFVMACEDAFGMTIPDEQVEKLNTVGDAVDYIFANLPADEPVKSS